MLKKIKKNDTVTYRHYDGRTFKVLVCRVHRDKTLTVPAPAELGYDRPLLRIGLGEVVRDVCKVTVEVGWGREWNGSYYAETPGVGQYVTVTEKITPIRERGPGFRGCPLGSGPTENQAIYDFVNRSKSEWLGTEPLTRDMIEVVERRDFRKDSEGGYRIEPSTK
jgi:hypothetical protein